MIPTNMSTGTVVTTGSENTVTLPSSSGGLFDNNPIIASYSFPQGERVPQKVASELNFIITKITRILDAKAGSDRIKKTRYYQAASLSILNRLEKTTSEKDKRILEYLHTRLVTVSRGILSLKPAISQVAAIGEPAMVSPPLPTVSMEPMRTPVSTIAFSSLGIDFGHPAFTNYNFSQNRRFPRTITTVLDRFTESIVRKIDSIKNHDTLYNQIFTLLDERIQTTADTKERKILQYIRNHVYIAQQEEKIGQSY